MTRSSHKKRRVGDLTPLVEFNGTPYPDFRKPDSYFASASPCASEASSVSKVSSSKRRIMSLRLGKAGVDHRVLNENTVPSEAKELFFLMDAIGRGLGIVPHALKSAIEEKLKDQPMSLRRWDSAFMPQGHDDGLPGRIPSVKEVEGILAKAVNYEGRQYEESMWTAEVLLCLLEGIFDDPDGEPRGEFNALMCSTARPHMNFEAECYTGKTIDICIFSALDENQELIDALVEFSSAAPTLTVNHTDFDPLQLRPLVLSIVNKRPGLEWDKAQLQIGAWHAAQWAFLRWAVGTKLRKQRAAQRAAQEEEEEKVVVFRAQKESQEEVERREEEEVREQEELRAQERAVLSKLAFIPGIIVQGNRWHLVLSTYHEEKTTIWAEWVFGTTKSLMDIYSVVAGVRQLTAWARDVYLPWFLENVLM
ncbi:hypothetical protein THARTR1_08237 [Trichoderma harzianum]|uniref:PD-(D/E)XK nuclease-like domain-containing protein n=1 Tax=Trichoderma harzianum TaxID=5544 RepID=A0A2K0U081_TRIHA|nr:hypothetical protein THARTR1_08237 [Trichoderma harzianum]